MIKEPIRWISTKDDFLKRKILKSSFYNKFLFIAVLSAFFIACKPSPHELFTTYFEPYNAPGTFQSEDPILLDDDFILALARYDEGNYGEAAQFFTKSLEKNPDKDVAVFLRGVSNLANDNLGLAEVDLNEVAGDGESLFVEHAMWYLALLHLRKGDKDSAELVLKELKEVESVNELMREMGI